MSELHFLVIYQPASRRKKTNKQNQKPKKKKQTKYRNRVLTAFDVLFHLLIMYCTLDGHMPIKFPKTYNLALITSCLGDMKLKKNKKQRSWNY